MNRAENNERGSNNQLISVLGNLPTMQTECSCSLLTLPKKTINNDFPDQENSSLESGSMRVSIFIIASRPNGARDVSEVMLSDTSHFDTA